MSRFLPYALLTFVGIAGWAMNSSALLAMVVVGTVGVSVGTAVAARGSSKGQSSSSS